MSLFQIKTTCHEDWNSMKIGIRSRHCESCKKDMNGNFNFKSKCILNLLLLMIVFTTSQIKVLSQSNKSENNKETLKISKLAKDNPLTKEKPKVINFWEYYETNSHRFRSSSCPNLGGANPRSEGPDDLKYKAEIMPEFDGGYDSLVNFITSNLKYPDWERQNKIEGIVYVGFTINKDGSISDILINVSVAASKNFDTEVIRVIKSMPKWIPGENEGKKVRVRYHLPVKFKL